MKKIIVKKHNQRLDIFLVEELKKSRNKIQELVLNNNISINDKIVNKNGMILNFNDKIEITETKNDFEINSNIESYELDLEILYEDEYLLIINKPSGILTHPTSFNEKNTLANAIKYLFEKKKITTNPGIIHRLDKDTSGLIIIAKNLETLNLMQDMMQEKKITKRYYALVHNNIKGDNFIIDMPICRSMQSKLRMQVGEGKNFKNAITEVEVIERFSTYCLLICTLHTGRTHQIRVHLRHINHPLVNDPLYGVDKNPTEYGQYLCAYEIEFIHPINNKKINVKIELPEEFKKIIREIKLYEK